MNGVHTYEERAKEYDLTIKELQIIEVLLSERIADLSTMEHRDKINPETYLELKALKGKVEGLLCFRAWNE